MRRPCQRFDEKPSVIILTIRNFDLAKNEVISLRVLVPPQVNLLVWRTSHSAKLFRGFFLRFVPTKVGMAISAMHMITTVYLGYEYMATRAHRPTIIISNGILHQVLQNSDSRIQ